MVKRRDVLQAGVPVLALAAVDAVLDAAATQPPQNALKRLKGKLEEGEATRLQPL